MQNNKRWPLVVLIATFQLSAFMLAFVMLVTWSSQQQSQSLPGWWSFLILATTLVGVAAIGLMSSALKRFDKEHALSKLGLEQRLSDQSNELQRTQNAIIFGLAKLAERRDTDTGEHLDRIQKYVTILATDLSSKYPQLDKAAIRNLSFASSLHDIGKVGIPDSILLKPGRLTAGERKIMEHHTAIGGECLEAIQNRLGENEFMAMAREVAWSHHEHWNGTGYPRQLAGEEIPLVARIVSVADVYDAMTSKRPYKRAMTHGESRKVLLEGSGTQFDPDIIDAFSRHEDEFEAISISQRHVTDEECISGLQRMNDCVEVLQRESTDVIAGLPQIV